MKLTRREILKLGAGASVLSAAGGWGSLLADDRPLIEVTIPSFTRAMIVSSVAPPTNRSRLVRTVTRARARS